MKIKTAVAFQHIDRMKCSAKAKAALKAQILAGDKSSIFVVTASLRKAGLVK